MTACGVHRAVVLVAIARPNLLTRPSSKQVAIGTRTRVRICSSICAIAVGGARIASAVIDIQARETVSSIAAGAGAAERAYCVGASRVRVTVASASLPTALVDIGAGRGLIVRGSSAVTSVALASIARARGGNISARGACPTVRTPLQPSMSLQDVPSPLYPLSQAQLKEPAVLVQTASA